jgi:tetratricopeptide (TPR) repeat protein
LAVFFTFALARTRQAIYEEETAMQSVNHLKRAALLGIALSISLASHLAGAAAQTERQDYTDQLMKLVQSIENKQYREAISGFKSLEAQPGTPGWLRAASEYEIAELYGTLNEPDNAIAALSRAVQLGFDDCLTPRGNERLATILKAPEAAQALARMKITQADFRELVWLKSEVQHAHHDARIMIIENTNRLDHGITDIPQAQLPTRLTTSVGVLYWRQLLLVVQKVQRDYVRKADLQRLKHLTTMGVISGGASSSAVLESARRAQAAAESRRAAILQRTFVVVTIPSDRPRPCSEWN